MQIRRAHCEVRQAKIMRKIAVSIQALAMTVTWLPLALALAATSPAPSVDAGEGCEFFLIYALRSA